MSLRTRLMSFVEGPILYLTYQSLVGGIRARKICIGDYGVGGADQVVLDIGCGPGYTVQWLKGARYFGFDVSAASIAHAKRRFGRQGEFFCDYFRAEYLPRVPQTSS